MDGGRLMDDKKQANLTLDQIMSIIGTKEVELIALRIECSKLQEKISEFENTKMMTSSKD